MRNYRRIQTFLISQIKSKYNTADFCNVKNSTSFRFVHTSHQCQQTEMKQEEPKVLVYEGALKKNIKIVKLLSVSSSMLGFAMLPVALKDLSQISMILAGGVGLISTVFLSTPLLLNWITKRYVIQLNYDSQTKLFTAKTYNLLSQETELKFSASDVSVPDLPGMLSSFHAKGIPLFVDARMVKDPDAYSHMMGYDKPFDFKLQSEEQKDVKHPQ